MYSLKYLYYLVLCQQACPLCWGVFVHSSDVLPRSRPLAVQIEAVSICPSLDHTQPWPQFGANLLTSEEEKLFVRT